MPDKVRTVMELAEQTARRMTGSGEQWMSFLTTAARLYKYPYQEQLLIYAQRPEATACATYELWNRTMRRYVRRGAKGIALLDTSGETVRLRYVFDVADTGQRVLFRSVAGTGAAGRAGLRGGGGVLPGQQQPAPHDRHGEHRPGGGGGGGRLPGGGVWRARRPGAGRPVAGPGHPPGGRLLGRTRPGDSRYR